jgi:acyl homoserine lactone synthase
VNDNPESEMNARITIDRQCSFDPDALAQMFQLRAKIFGERMGWKVAILSGMEIDEYDALSPHYMLVRDDRGAVCGCWRLLPTEGPYMLRDTFPALLYGKDAPVSPRIWELSRFAIVSSQKTGFGFGGLALDAMRAVVAFADRHQVTHYVTVTTTAVERLLVRARIATRRFGPPMRIGKVDAVALTIDLGAQTHEALFDCPQPRTSSYEGVERLEQSLWAADKCTAELVKAQWRMHLPRQADTLGGRDANEGRSVVA